MNHEQISPAVRRVRGPARGFLMLDVVVGLTVVVALTIGLTVTVGEHHRALARLRDSAGALRLAERALAELQSGQPLSAPEQATVKVEPVTQAAETPGWRWVRISVALRRGGAELTGLVPQEPRR